MGHMTNQWVNQGRGLRSRGYKPVKVEIDCRKAKADDFSKTFGVALELFAWQGNRCQAMYLTHDEAEEIVRKVLEAYSHGKRIALVTNMLKELSDSDLLNVLSRSLKSRPD